MALVTSFTVATNNPNTIGLGWLAPVGFNNVDQEIIITRSTSHYPVELYNADFANTATDPRPVEVYRGKSIVGLFPAFVSVSGSTLVDTSASFPVSPTLAGRLLRDKLSNVYRIVSNTDTSVTVSGIPAAGKYVILPDFPQTITLPSTFVYDSSTVVGPGFISNLVQILSSGNLSANFIPDIYANNIFYDNAGSKFIVKSNDETTLYFYETDTPDIGILPTSTTQLLSNFVNGSVFLYLDNFKTDLEAKIRVGTGLLGDVFYYYTAFIKPFNTNVAQASYSPIDSGVSTQGAAISIADSKLDEIIYTKFWPTVNQELDSTGDLQDLMKVFGFQFEQLYSLVKTYRLQDCDSVYANAVLPLSEQTGLPTVGYAIGADTLRRIAKNLISCWRLKGSKQGIANFIRMITTWDITGGTLDYNSAISDFLPNVSAFTLFSSSLGQLNTRFTKTSPSFVAGGRFAKSLPGVVIPGFFTFREFVVTIPDVALFIGTTSVITTGGGTTTITTTQNYGAVNSLVGNYILPNQEEINDIYQIISNTSNTVTVSGIVNNRAFGGSYAILSPLNANRFTILNKLMSNYIPYGTLIGYQFI